MEAFWQDLRYAARMLARSPGFTLVVVLTLALGIGANATIFSVVNALLLRPFPAEKPEELIAVYTSDFSGPLFGSSSYPDYLYFREKSAATSGLLASTVTPLRMDIGDDTQRVFAEVVSENYLSVLGVRPRPGRGFLAEPARAAEAQLEVVLSEALWNRAFSADPTLIGRTVALNGQTFTVVGIAPASYPGLNRGVKMDLWVPLSSWKLLFQNQNRIENRGSRGLQIVGRRKPGVTLEQAQAEFRVLGEQLHAAYPDFWRNHLGEPRQVTVRGESAIRVHPGIRDPVVAFLAVLLTVVGLVLLAACANIANLFLSRASARRRELAIRLSLGASRGRVVQQLVTESVLAALLGGVAGLLVAAWGKDLLMSFQPPVPIPVGIDLELDSRVLAFAFLLSLLTGVFCGLLPALSSSRPNLVPALKDEGSIAAGRGRSRLRNAFVVAQVAVSLLLLIGSGLTLRSLRNATAIDPGFDPANVIVMSFDLDTQGYAADAGREFYRQLLERVRAVPGVEAAGLAEELPLGLGGGRRNITVDGYQPQPGEEMEIHSTMVASGYFEALRIPVLLGRTFTDGDRRGAQPVAVVNEAFARRYWPGENPLGKRVILGSFDAGTNPAQIPWSEVVGVVKDGKYVTLGEEPRPFLYLPLAQEYEGHATLTVRTPLDPAAILPAIRREVQALDARLPVFDTKTMTDHLQIALFPARVASSVMGLFGGVALLLATLGLYGVIAFSVVQRTREIGVRMALGATRGDILRLVLRQGVRLTGVGMALGLGAAIGVTRLMTFLLYGITPLDPVTYGSVVVLLAGVAAAACYLPARRATRVDPMMALRYE